MHSGLTKQWLGKIPLVIGIPVMITHNFDVENGIVNGCTGILKVYVIQQMKWGIDMQCHV